MKIALVGSPNVGKSAIFGCLTGRYAAVSNYPGTTVELARGSLNVGGAKCEIVDTPGLYSIYPITDEERVALDIIERGSVDIIIHVIDAKNLVRLLPLTFQLQNFGIPMILVLNMFDEAEKVGISMDAGLLSRKLEIPVVPTVAVTGDGIGRLKEAIQGLAPSRAKASVPAFSEGLMKRWSKKASGIASQVVTRRKAEQKLSRMDRILMSPATGVPILLGVVYLGFYKFVGGFGAGVVVDFLEGLFESYVNTPLAQLMGHLHVQPISDLIAGEYGIVSLGIRYAVAIILPIVGLFFLVFALIEDSGYLPRLSFLLDGTFKKMGLSGRAVIPMVLGLGCGTMATLVTRTLSTRREKVIATVLLALCIPCSAQLGVIFGLLSDEPSVLMAWLLILLLIFAAVGFGLSRIVPGARPTFVIEVPPMRFPQLKNVIAKTFARMTWYFREIVPLFILASIIIWLLQILGLFDWIEKGTAFVLSQIGLPADSAKAFILGFFRRDYGAAGLYDLYGAGAFSNNQLLIAVVVLTLFLPCITQFLMMIKERGWKIGFGISLFVLCSSFLVGAVLNLCLGWFEISL